MDNKSENFIGFEQYIDDGEYTGNNKKNMLNEINRIFRNYEIEYFYPDEHEYKILNYSIDDHHYKNFDLSESIDYHTEFLLGKIKSYGIFIGGWQKHAVGYVIKKNDDDTYDFVICNKGEGVDLFGAQLIECNGSILS